MLGSAESEMVRLIRREIITDKRTDGRTDNLPSQYRATRAVKKRRKFAATRRVFLDPI